MSINAWLLTALALAANPGAEQQPGAETEATPGKGMLLIARRDMPDPRFRQSVILLVDHGEGGSLGLIVNRPSEVTLSEALPELDAADEAEHCVYFGGPVELDRLELLVRADAAPAGASQVLDNIYVSADRDTLVHLLERGKPDDELRAYFGYAGWGRGQLVRELARHDWHLQPARADLVFSDDPGGLWARLIESHDPAGQMVRAHDE